MVTQADLIVFAQRVREQLGEGSVVFIEGDQVVVSSAEALGYTPGSSVSNEMRITQLLGAKDFQHSMRPDNKPWYRHRQRY